MMTEVCCFKQPDDHHMKTTAIYSTGTGTSSSHNSSQVHINLDESVTHHLNELTLDAFQREVATNFLSNEFINAFTQYCDDSYSSEQNCAPGVETTLFNKMFMVSISAVPMLMSPG
jgi:hypothetical protein